MESHDLPVHDDDEMFRARAFVALLVRAVQADITTANAQLTCRLAVESEGQRLARAEDAPKWGSALARALADPSPRRAAEQLMELNRDVWHAIQVYQ